MSFEPKSPTHSVAPVGATVAASCGHCEHTVSDCSPSNTCGLAGSRAALHAAELRQDRLLQAFNPPERKLPSLAKLDASSIVILGLFTSLGPRDLARGRRLEFKKILSYGDVNLTVACPGPLGDSDQRVLRGLVAQATDQYATLVSARVHGRAEGGDASPQVRAQCTLVRLAEVAGFGSPLAGPTHTVLRKALARLSGVTLRWESSRDGSVTEEKLIVNQGSPAGHGGVNVAFHSRLQAAILAGGEGEHYYKLGMDEARALRSPCARLLHHRLTHMNESAKTPHAVKTLEGYLWLDPALTRHAESNRRIQLLKAIEELERIGWRFEPSTEHQGCLDVMRPVANSFRSVEALAVSTAAQAVSKV